MEAVVWAAVSAGCSAAAAIVTCVIALAEHRLRKQHRKSDALKGFMGWSNPDELALALQGAFIEFGGSWDKNIEDLFVEIWRVFPGETPEKHTQLMKHVGEFRLALLANAKLDKVIHRMASRERQRRKGE